eukprot:m.287178 g.287178  ORF g.287178 m.287178 type:complete len:628 (+) comp11726_c0_seq1:2106-3989(+)
MAFFRRQRLSEVDDDENDEMAFNVALVPGASTDGEPGATGDDARADAGSTPDSDTVRSPRSGAASPRPERRAERTRWRDSFRSSHRKDKDKDKAEFDNPLSPRASPPPPEADEAAASSGATSSGASKKEKGRTGFRKLLGKPRRTSKAAPRGISSQDHKVASASSPQDWRVFGIALEDAVLRSVYGSCVDVPDVVRKIVLFVEAHGLELDNLYRGVVSKDQTSRLKTAFDTGIDVCFGAGPDQSEPSADDIHVAAALLKLYLEELPDPILTSELGGGFSLAMGLPDQASRVKRLEELLAKLPACNRALLAWICLHLRNVVAHCEENKLDLKNAATTFGTVLNISQELFSLMIERAASFFVDISLEDRARDEQRSSQVPRLEAFDISSLAVDSDVAMDAEILLLEQALSRHLEQSQACLARGTEYPDSEDMWALQRHLTELKRAKRKRSGLARTDSVETPGELSSDMDSTVASPTEEESSKVVADVLQMLHDELKFQEGELSAVNALLREQLRQEKEERQRVQEELNALGGEDEFNEMVDPDISIEELEIQLEQLQAQRDHLETVRNEMREELVSERNACVAAHTSIKTLLSQSHQDFVLTHDWVYRTHDLPQGSIDPFGSSENLSVV